MSSTTHPQRVSLEDSRHGAAIARRNAATSIAAVVAVSLIWASAQAARSLDFPERTTKAVIAAVVAIAACVQIVLGVTMTMLTRASAIQAPALRRAHRTVGSIALLGGAFVAYLCLTGPFPGGPTLHRVVGFAVCAAVLVKIPVVTNVPQRRMLVTVLGLMVGIGLISAFFTNGFDVLRNSS